MYLCFKYSIGKKIVSVEVTPTGWKKGRGIDIG